MKKSLRAHVLQGKDKAAFALDHLGDHVVDETMLVPDLGLFKLALVLVVVELLEDVLEFPIVCLENGVLGAHVKRHLLVEGHLEGSVCETSDGLGGVVHAHADSSTFREVKDVPLLLLSAILGSKNHLELASAWHDKVLAAVLVTKGVPSDANRLGPPWHGLGDTVEHDWLAEDGSAEDVSDCSVGREPHLFEVEFLDSGLVWGDGCALDADLVLLDCLCCFDSDLVIGLIAVLHSEVIVLEVNVEKGENELLLDLVPDDAGHFITVHLDDGVVDLDLLSAGHVGCLASE
jgi:hypothetical protein